MKNIKKRNDHAISAAIVSAYHTYIFMYNLGLSIVMGLVGLALQPCA